VGRKLAWLAVILAALADPACPRFSKKLAQGHAVQGRINFG